MADAGTQAGRKTYAVTDDAGTEWVLSPIETGGAIGEFEDYLEGVYRLAAHKTCFGAPEGVYGRTLAEASAKIAAGEFAFGGRRMLEMIQQDAHRAKLLQLALLPRHPRATHAEALALLKARRELVADALAELNPHTFTRLPAPDRPAGDDGPKEPPAGPPPNTPPSPSVVG